MKKIISTFIVLSIVLTTLFTMTVPAAAEEYSGECGNSVYWSLDTQDQTLLIYGEGKMTGYPYHSRWEEYKDSIETIVIQEGVTSIGPCAFKKLDKLKSVTIPNSVEIICSDAFSYCDSLTMVTIPGKIQEIEKSAFSNCTSLEEVIILEGVKSIEDSAFSGCTSLKTIFIPSTVRGIGSKAFGDCSSLKQINFGGTESEWTSMTKDSDWAYRAGAYSISYEATADDATDDEDTNERKRDREENETGFSVLSVFIGVAVGAVLSLFTAILILIIKSKKKRNPNLQNET